MRVRDRARERERQRGSEGDNSGGYNGMGARAQSLLLLDASNSVLIHNTPTATLIMSRIEIQFWPNNAYSLLLFDGAASDASGTVRKRILCHAFHWKQTTANTYFVMQHSKHSIDSFLFYLNQNKLQRQ